jgi:hypothetical protein
VVSTSNATTGIRESARTRVIDHTRASG